MFLRKKLLPEVSVLSSLDQLSVESGVSNKFFSHAFLGSLERFSVFFGLTDHDKDQIVATGRAVLARRRKYLLPSGCDPEQLHREKDKWTLAVWMAHLFAYKTHHSGVALYAFLPWLEEMLEPKAWGIIKSDPLLLESLIGVISGVEATPNSKALRQILSGEGGDRKTAHDVPPLSRQEPNSEPRPSSPDLPKNPLILGFLEYVRDHLTELPDWLLVKRNQYHVVFPRGLVVYSMEKQIDFNELKRAFEHEGMLNIVAHGRQQFLLLSQI